MTLRIFFIFFVINTCTFAQNNGKSFSFFIGGDYITSAQIFLNPNSSDIVIKNKSFEIQHLYSPVIDFRYRLNEDIILGISSEYISKSEKGRNLSVAEGSQIIELEVEDGVLFIPIELSAYYYLPFSTEQFKFTMGAGVGYYYGEQARKFGDTQIQNLKKENAIGILVSIGMEYLILKQIGLRFDMKFRDPEVELTSRYLKSVVNYKGSQINLSQDSFDSKINLDGISFLFGLSFQF